MARQAFVDQFEIGLDGVLEVDAAFAHGLDRLEDVFGRQGDVLDAFAVVAADEFLDLGILVLAFVQRDADGAVGRDHGLGEQARRLALDVEILLLFEVEHRAVEARPGAHLAATDVVGQVVQDLQTHGVLALGLFPALDLVPGVIQRAVLAVLVDDVQQAAADALQHIGVVAGQGAAARAFGLAGAARQRALIGGLGVGDAEGHAVGRWAVVLGEVRRLPGGRAVDQHGDVALLQAHHAVGRVHMGGGEAHQLQARNHRFGLGAGEFDELEAVDAEGVFLVEFGGVLHDASPLSYGLTRLRPTWRGR